MESGGIFFWARVTVTQRRREMLKAKVRLWLRSRFGLGRF